MAALQFVDIPDYSALLLRRTFSDLTKPDSLIPKSFQWLAETNAEWNGSRHQWKFPKSGATLSFGYLDAENDIYQYQSSAYTFIGFDELTQFSERQYRYLFSRLRKPEGMKVPLRMRAGTNPGGIGHSWVRERFITNGVSDGRIFIRSKLEDNPHLDPSYRESLAQLDHITRRQLEHGDWDIIAGGLLFQRQWFPIVEVAPASYRKCRHWDLAATKPKQGSDPSWTVGTLMSKTREGKYCIEDVRRIQNTPLEVENLILQTAQVDGREVMVSIEQEPGSGGVNTIDHYQRVVLAGYHFEKDKPATNKAARANPLSSSAEAGLITILRGAWNGAWLDEVELFPTGAHNDQVDSASGVFNKLNSTHGAFESAEQLRVGPTLTGRMNPFRR